MQCQIRWLVGVVSWLILAIGTFPAAGQGSTGWTYQGRLDSDGAPADGDVPMEFRLWDDPAAGRQMGDTLVFDGSVGNSAPVEVVGGLFSVVLDFGGAVDGRPLWLEITVDGNTLTPRQRLLSAPYALYSAAPWESVGFHIAYDGGSVGIGTTNPGARLDVVGGIVASSYTSTLRQGAHLEWNRAGGDGATWLLNHRGLGAGGIRFCEYDPTNFVVRERMRIASDGNVGIGTTSPESPLHVAGIMQADNRLQLGGSNQNTDPVHLTRVDAGTDHTQLVITVGDNPGSSPSPGDELIIAAGTQTQFIFRSNGDAYKTGFPTWGTVSDARTKHDIEPLAGSLDRLMHLHGRTFYYNDPDMPGAGPGKRTGLVAQEVEPYFPEWIGTMDEDTKTLNIVGFEAITIEALRDLRSEKDDQIAALEAESASLRQENEELRGRLDTLERLVAELVQDEGRS